MSLLENILQKDQLSKEDIVFLLSLENKEDLEKLYEKAYRIKLENVGNKVFFRGLIELSNICHKDCIYCGIRKSNKNPNRYIIDPAHVAEAAKWALDAEYGSLALQAGERTDEKFIEYISTVLEKVREVTKGKLGVTLSLGEHSPETYRKWFELGSHRYLLRIETTNRELFKKLHPDDDFDERIACMESLREIGYQVGTGIMIGIPGQTAEDLAKDILFFKENDIDMIGMGPFIPHSDTPMADSIEDFEKNKERQLEMGLKMIAITRIVLKDVNIASTTALQALHPVGREMGLKAGANIIMPNVTETKFRSGYQLYDNKPGIDENSESSRNALDSSISEIGEEIGYNQWGDSPHFRKKKNSF